jgi:hypothetical protein
MHRVAVAFFGAMCHQHGQFVDPVMTADIIDPTDTAQSCNLYTVKNSLQRHILDVNAEFGVDVFVHSWTTHMAKDFIDAYSPVKATFQTFEHDAFQAAADGKGVPALEVSRHASMQAVLRSVADHERFRNRRYDYVVLTRPDVLLWKDMRLSSYDPERVYNNKGNGGSADFHFVMNSTNAEAFSAIYDYLGHPELSSLTRGAHYGLNRAFVSKFMGLSMFEDEIDAGYDEEVLRKVEDFRLVDYGAKRWMGT